MSGISLFFMLTASLLLFNLVAVTERGPAISLAATILAKAEHSDGLDDPQKLTELRTAISRLPGDSIAPLPQLPDVVLTKQEVLQLDAYHIRLRIFEQLFGQIYDQGPDALSKLAALSPTEASQLNQQLIVFGLFTKSVHETLRTLFWVFVALGSLSLAQLVYFSARWGRLASPGVVALQASTVGALVAYFLPSLDRVITQQLPPAPLAALTLSLRQSYLPVFVLGVGLLIVAAIGKLITNIILRHREHQALATKELMTPHEHGDDHVLLRSLPEDDTKPKAP